MDRLLDLRRKWPFFALIPLYLYLAFHALSGSKGLVRWAEYENDIKHFEKRLETARSKRLALEAHAENLQPGQINLDMLDIKAREFLFVSRPNEKTIWLDEPPL